MACPTVGGLTVPLKLSEDFYRENIISLSLYEISKYLQQKPCEITESTAYNQSIILATLTELCCDIEDPGDAFVYVKILNLLIQVRKYLAECPGIPSKPAEGSLHQKARDIHSALIQLRSQFSGSMVGRIDELIAEAQCQVVLSGIMCEDTISAQHFIDAFITAPVQMPKQLSSQLQEVLASVSPADARPTLLFLLTQHSPRVLYDMTSSFIIANLPFLFHRSPMYKHMKNFIEAEGGSKSISSPQNSQEMGERDRCSPVERPNSPPKIPPTSSVPASDAAASEPAPNKVSKIPLKVPRVVLSRVYSKAFWEQRRKTFRVNLNKQKKNQNQSKGLRSAEVLLSTAVSASSGTSKRGRRPLLSSDEEEGILKGSGTDEGRSKGGRRRRSLLSSDEEESHSSIAEEGGSSSHRDKNTRPFSSKESVGTSSHTSSKVPLACAALSASPSVPSFTSKRGRRSLLSSDEEGSHSSTAEERSTGGTSSRRDKHSRPFSGKEGVKTSSPISALASAVSAPSSATSKRGRRSLLSLDEEEGPLKGSGTAEGRSKGDRGTGDTGSSSEGGGGTSRPFSKVPLASASHSASSKRGRRSLCDGDESSSTADGGSKKGAPSHRDKLSSDKESGGASSHSPSKVPLASAVSSSPSTPSITSKRGHRSLLSSDEEEGPPKRSSTVEGRSSEGRDTTSSCRDRSSRSSSDKESREASSHFSVKVPLTSVAPASHSTASKRGRRSVLSSDEEGGPLVGPSTANRRSRRGKDTPPSRRDGVSSSEGGGETSPRPPTKIPHAAIASASHSSRGHGSTLLLNVLKNPSTAKGRSREGQGTHSSRGEKRPRLSSSEDSERTSHHARGSHRKSPSTAKGRSRDTHSLCGEKRPRLSSSEDSGGTSRHSGNRRDGETLSHKNKRPRNSPHSSRGNGDIPFSNRDVHSHLSGVRENGGTPSSHKRGQHPSLRRIEQPDYSESALSSDELGSRSSDEQGNRSSDEQGNREEATIKRKVRRRSVENVTTRKTVVEVSDEIYDFSDEEERTPASKLPGRLPELKIRPYQDFAPRPQPVSHPPSHTRKPTPTRPRKGRGVMFSKEETAYLREGMRKYGTHGCWKIILDAYPFHPSRTSTSLKDRARNMNGRNQQR